MTRRFVPPWPAVSLLLILGSACSDVIAPVPEPVTVQPRNVTLAPFESFQLRIYLTPELTGLPVAWSSTDTSVAQVTPTGIVTAGGSGFAKIFASVGSERGYTFVTVLEPGGCWDPDDLFSCW